MSPKLAKPRERAALFFNVAMFVDGGKKCNTMYYLEAQIVIDSKTNCLRVCIGMLIVAGKLGAS